MLRATKVVIDLHSLEFNNGLIIAKEIDLNGLILNANYFNGEIPVKIKQFFNSKSINLKILRKKTTQLNKITINFNDLDSNNKITEHYIMLAGVFHLTKEEITAFIKDHPDYNYKHLNNNTTKILTRLDNNKNSNIEKLELQSFFNMSLNNSIKISVTKQYHLLQEETIYTNWRFYWKVPKANEASGLSNLIQSSLDCQKIHIRSASLASININCNSLRTTANQLLYKNFDNKIHYTNAGIMSSLLSLSNISINFKSKFYLHDTMVEAADLIIIRSLLNDSAAYFFVDKKIDWLNNPHNNIISNVYNKSEIYQCKIQNLYQSEDQKECKDQDIILPIGGVVSRPTF